jgi:hypothetical protein
VKSCIQHWRRIVATTATILAGLRIVIWIAKAIASAGTVDTALNLIGLGEYVKPYEDFVDGIINSVWDFIMNLNMMLQ